MSPSQDGTNQLRKKFLESSYLLLCTLFYMLGTSYCYGVRIAVQNAKCKGQNFNAKWKVQRPNFEFSTLLLNFALFTLNFFQWAYSSVG